MNEEIGVEKKTEREAKKNIAKKKTNLKSNSKRKTFGTRFICVNESWLYKSKHLKRTHTRTHPRGWISRTPSQ